MDTKDKLYGTPGGHLEYGEEFELCAQRELEEELDLKLEQSDIKYLTTLNVRRPEVGVHYLNIFMATFISEEQELLIKNLD